jgi:hypothetical protein
LHDTNNAPGSVYTVGDNASDAPAVYLESSFLWGEVETQIGSTIFKINRDAPDPADPSQHLPSSMRLNLEYSGALLAAMRNLGEEPPGFDASTGEFWVGRFRCGSAIPATSSPYRISVQLLQDGREVAKRQYTVGVLSYPNCDDGSKDEPGGPPRRF